MQEKEAAIFEQLLSLSHRLGEPERDLVILGDGNTSARIDDDTFWIKASGAYLHQISVDGFTRLRLSPLLEMIDSTARSDADIQQGGIRPLKRSYTRWHIHFAAHPSLGILIRLP